MRSETNHSSKSTETAITPAAIKVVFDTIVRVFAFCDVSDMARPHVHLSIMAASAAHSALARLGGDKWAMIDALEGYIARPAEALGLDLGLATRLIDHIRQNPAFPGQVHHEAQLHVSNIFQQEKCPLFAAMGEVAELACWSRDRREVDFESALAWNVLGITEALVVASGEHAAIEFACWLSTIAADRKAA